MHTACFFLSYKALYWYWILCWRVNKHYEKKDKIENKLRFKMRI